MPVRIDAEGPRFTADLTLVPVYGQISTTDYLMKMVANAALIRSM
ncbi:hypothetical protein EV681_2335 [Advenella incenata]|uniref:Uncharacterized protein n=1 Tax=Advenella incenata TaxID=267800 RepID=A0A4Q7VEC0_9BURK|nr:hypothetical protein EV681_2335 [Advenella incenata]